jgi:hypothetical protein
MKVLLFGWTEADQRLVSGLRSELLHTQVVPDEAALFEGGDLCLIVAQDLAPDELRLTATPANSSQRRSEEVACPAIPRGTELTLLPPAVHPGVQIGQAGRTEVARSCSASRAASEAPRRPALVKKVRLFGIVLHAAVPRCQSRANTSCVAPCASSGHHSNS